MMNLPMYSLYLSKKNALIHNKMIQIVQIILSFTASSAKFFAYISALSSLGSLSFQVSLML